MEHIPSTFMHSASRRLLIL